jgi:beta-N-acetylhexosaminidase
MRVFYILVILIICKGTIATQIKGPAYLEDRYFIWADSVLRTMSIDEKIGQLLMPRGNYSGQPHDMKTLRDWVVKYKVGGIAFFATHPLTQAKVTNEIQALSKVPLLIGQDFEWGLGMRLDSTDKIHYNMTLGAMDGGLEVLTKIGEEIGKQCKRMGVHVNYAPVVDVNNNPNNPVINFRSFGSNKENVAEKALAVMKGIQSQNIICTAKHFPGHGDTDVDSHHDLPVIKHDINRLKSVELFPFQKLIDHGLTGIMSAHLSIPTLEKNTGMASTFSANIITNLLKKDMGFRGLVFTDAMDMQGAVKNYPKGEAMVRALLAGNDVLETFLDVPTAFEAIKAAVNTKQISIELLDSKVRKVLAAKSWVGLGQYRSIDLQNLVNDLNVPAMDLYNRVTAEESVTCLFNKRSLLPIRDLTKKIVVLGIGTVTAEHFYPMVKNYTDVQYIGFPQNGNAKQVDSIFGELDNYDIVIASVHLTDIRSSRNYGITPIYADVIKRLIKRENVIINLLGNVFILNVMPEMKDAQTLLIGYQQNKYIEEASAQVIFGGLPCKGKLPVGINTVFVEGMSVPLSGIDRLSYGIPEQLGLNGEELKFRLDTLINSGLEAKAYPGAVVSVAYKGKVVYQNAYGGQTFDHKSMADEKFMSKVEKIDDAMDNFSPSAISVDASAATNSMFKFQRKDDIYDLASITKIAASALAIMQLKSQNKFDENASFSHYYKPFENTNKANLTYKDMLTHRSGLAAWIPFWRDGVDTIAMVAKISESDQLSGQLIYDVTKVGWLARLFGKKGKRVLNIQKSLEFNRGLMDEALKLYGPIWKEFTFSSARTSQFPHKIHENLYLYKDRQELLIKRIADSAIKPGQGYVYSDLHYYTYPEMVKEITGKGFEAYLDETYQRLGAKTLTFNPLNKFSKDRIVPTEFDSLYRRTLIHGYVHDEGASMLNGVSGHAGLFGNANDLTKLMQMYLQKGSYGGYQYFKPEVIESFTAYQFPQENNRRGLAFDKKDLNPAIANGPKLASPESFGHSGFTGTFTWVDPKSEVVYVFLSNRVYPTRTNNKISSMNIRTQIGDIILDCINKGNTNSMIK